jgi:hypothetical protein
LVPPALRGNPYENGISTVAVTAAHGDALLLSAAGAPLAQPLPAISAAVGGKGGAGSFFLCRDTNQNGPAIGQVTLTPAGGDTINVLSTPFPVPRGGAVLLRSDGVSNWQIVAAWGLNRIDLPEQWKQDNVSASQTNVDLTTIVSVTYADFQATRAGSIVGLSTRFNEAVLGGLATVYVTINGTEGTLFVDHNAGTNINGGVATQYAGIDNYVAGDLLGVSITTSAGFLPPTTDLQAVLQVEEGP